MRLPWNDSLCLSSLLSRASPTAPAAAQQRREHPASIQVTSSYRLTTGHAMQTCAAAHGSLLECLSPSCDLKPGVVIILSSSSHAWQFLGAVPHRLLRNGFCGGIALRHKCHGGPHWSGFPKVSADHPLVLCSAVQIAVCDRARICQDTHQPPPWSQNLRGCTCRAGLFAASMQKITELLLRSAGLQPSVIVKSLPDQLHRELGKSPHLRLTSLISSCRVTVAPGDPCPPGVVSDVVVHELTLGALHS